VQVSLHWHRNEKQARRLRPDPAGLPLRNRNGLKRRRARSSTLRPLNVETLATLVYGNASRGAFEDGSFAALVIVLIGILPVLQLVRSAESPARRAAMPAS
jgi:hypothetical protein